MRLITKICYDWAVRCFGAQHVHNRKVRALRLAEEAVELCQALEVPQDQMFLLVDTVYKRPAGIAMQELGGVLMTAHVLSATYGRDPDDVLEIEVFRVLNKTPEEFAKRNQNKLDLGLKGS